MIIKPSQTLAYFAIKHNGDWDNTYRAICEKNEIDYEECKNILDNLKCKYITIIDKNYPTHLKNIYKPPLVLFYYGDISLIERTNNVGVVGSRDCSAYGRKITEELVKGITDEYAIVSGLAKGIDTVAHETAIKYKGKTIAVLGSGIDYCYPKCNQELYKEIKENHLLISEYPGELEPCPSYFPIRNRIVTGLSKALLVTEAYKMSGTLISVKLALEFGKTIMCVPYEADKKSMCNKLIKDGAYMVESCDDIKDLLR